MAWRVAFIGFRHGHIFALYNLLRDRPDVRIVAACEEDGPTRETLGERGVAVTHDDYGRMLAEADCDIVACGDCFGLRGARLIAALERGRHVIGDKPLCTRHEELDRIEALAREKGLRVGCMLDMRDSPLVRTLRRLVGEGAVGEVHSVCFNGQHPLFHGLRPDWYYAPDLHGGTINDIAVHAFDAIPWITGRAVAEVVAARAWNARLPEHPAFQDAAQVMLRLENGAGVLGDVSYLGPDGVGYDLPWYWRFTLAGSEGSLDSAWNAGAVTLVRRESPQPETVPFDSDRPGGYFEDFLADIAGRAAPDALDTESVLRGSRWALEAQRAADSFSSPR